MEFFPDRTHVWLWAREYEAYVYAREDGEDIAACRDIGAAPLRATWAVHRLVRDGADYVLFHNASNGRYLAIVPTEDGNYCLPVQCTYDSPEQDNVLFQAVRADEDDSDDLFLRHFTFDIWSRPPDEDTPTPTPLHWVVEAIPPRLLPPELPVPPELRIPPVLPGGRRVYNLYVLRRTIHYVRPDNQGNLDQLQWRILQFEGQSVFKLRRDLAAALGEANNGLGLTLCSWAGSNGRLTPLVIDLPWDENAMNIVVLTTGSPAAQALVYPNVDAP